MLISTSHPVEWNVLHVNVEQQPGSRVSGSRVLQNAGLKHTLSSDKEAGEKIRVARRATKIQKVCENTQKAEMIGVFL